MHIIVIGNPTDGFRFEGPFDSAEDAVAEGEQVSEDWWLAPLTPPQHVSDEGYAALAQDPEQQAYQAARRAQHTTPAGQPNTVDS